MKHMDTALQKRDMIVRCCMDSESSNGVCIKHGLQSQAFLPSRLSLQEIEITQPAFQAHQSLKETMRRIEIVWNARIGCSQEIQEHQDFYIIQQGSALDGTLWCWYTRVFPLLCKVSFIAVDQFISRFRTATL